MLNRGACGGPLHERVEADLLDCDVAIEPCVTEWTYRDAVSIDANPHSHSSVRRLVGLSARTGPAEGLCCRLASCTTEPIVACDWHGQQVDRVRAPLLRSAVPLVDRDRHIEADRSDSG